MIPRYTLTHYEEEQACPDGEHVRFAYVEPLLAELAELRTELADLRARSTDICVVWA